MTANYFSVIQYVPDLEADERINVGVILYDHGEVRSVVLNNWNRVKSFGGQTTSVRNEVSQLIDLIERETAVSEPDDIRVLWGEFGVKLVHSLQLTSPRASLLPLEELAEYAHSTLLKDHEIRRRGRSKTTLVANTRMRLMGAIGRAIGNSEDFVRNNEVVMGRYSSHEVDIAVKNGSLILVAQALSFDRSNRRNVQKDIESTAFVMDDIRNSEFSVPMSVILGRPRDDMTREYKQARELFGLMDVGVVTESRISAWATEQAQLVKRKTALT